MKPLPDMMPPRLSLPQNDKDQPGRARALEEARGAYRYTYSKANIRGLAMCDTLPKSEEPDVAWRASMSTFTQRLASNAFIEAGLPPTQDVKGLAQAVMDGGLAAAAKVVGKIVVEGERGRPMTSLQDFAGLFHTFPVPSESADYFLDSNFAHLRVAGPNPGWIRQVDPKTGVADDFAVTADHYAASCPEGDSLEAALAEGRLFVCEYRELQGIRAGCVPVPPGITVDYAKDPAAWDAAYKAREASYAQGDQPKAMVAPLALFSVFPGEGKLSPIAIQLFPNGYEGRTYPVFTPKDGLSWLAAKSCVNAADGVVHEVISHLGRTHLVQEAVYLSLHNNLSARHPLHRLLVPHFLGTFAINEGADREMVIPGSWLDQLLMPTIGETLALCGRVVRERDWNSDHFPTDLQSRGVDSSEILRDYPYRDDGKLVWQALSTWVSGFVEHTYPDDAALRADLELQSFVRELTQYNERDAAGRLRGGGLRGVGEGGPSVQTRAYLTRMLTQVIWTGSAQHAAVNFPQGDAMVYAPNFPLGLRAPTPKGGRFTEEQLLSLLPDHSTAHVQLYVLKLLSSLHHTRLGHYPRGPLGASHFGPGPLASLEQRLVADLDRVEAQIEERNTRRRPYPYLLPSKIPQSVNI